MVIVIQKTTMRDVIGMGVIVVVPMLTNNIVQIKIHLIVNALVLQWVMTMDLHINLMS